MIYVNTRLQLNLKMVFVLAMWKLDKYRIFLTLSSSLTYATLPPTFDHWIKRPAFGIEAFDVEIISLFSRRYSCFCQLMVRPFSKTGRPFCL